MSKICQKITVMLKSSPSDGGEPLSIAFKSHKATGCIVLPFFIGGRNISQSNTKLYHGLFYFFFYVEEIKDNLTGGNVDRNNVISRLCESSYITNSLVAKKFENHVHEF